MKLKVVALYCAIVGGALLGASQDSEVRAHVLARMGKTEKAGLGKLYVYSKQPLISVRYREIGEDQWSWMQNGNIKDGYYIYQTKDFHSSEEGTTFQVGGVNQKYIEIIDELVVEDESKIHVTGIKEEKLTIFPTLQRTTLLYGSSSIGPNVLAQARANEMARTNQMTHLGSGSVNTLVGHLSEGVGSGGRNCGTCVARNGTAAVGDGQRFGSKGSNFRCRLYNSPGTV